MDMATDEGTDQSPETSSSKRKNPFTPDDGLILPMFYWIFYGLSYVSLFSLIRVVSQSLWAKRHHCEYDKVRESSQWADEKPFTFGYVFPEVWALSNLVASILAGTFGYLIPWTPIQIILLIYAIERTFELFVYQINVLLFDPITGGDSYKIKSATRMVILLVMNMIEYTFWFSFIFSALAILLGGESDMGFVFVLESFSMITNISGPTEMTAVHFQFLAFVETLVGMFMNLVCLARFIGLLPKVEPISNN